MPEMLEIRMRMRRTLVVKMGIRINMCRDPWRINFLGYFGLFYEIPLFSYAFNHELIVFDGPIDAPMLNCYEINELLC